MASVSPHHPSALRNRGPIVAKLTEILSAEAAGAALEIASGTGAHLEVLAPALPRLRWQPSEYCPEGVKAVRLDALGKIGERTGGASELEQLDANLRGIANVAPAVALDASEPFERWPAVLQPPAEDPGQHRLVFVSNVCHISPWAVTLGLLSGAARLLAPGGALLIYGPFKVGGEFSTVSNREFDESLRARDAAWGYRDVGELVEAGSAVGLGLEAQHDMPANNLLLQFAKG